MKPYLLQTLKELALLGAVKNKVEISSFELAKQLDTSQQTASRYLLELDKNGMITRELGIKKQLIQITDLGEDVLQEEHLQYQQIFELANRIHFRGKVVSSMGEGRYYTEQSGYVEQFKDKLGFDPYPGTLNLRLSPGTDVEKLRDTTKGVRIEPQEGFCEARCFKAFVMKKVWGAVVMPQVPGYPSDLLEILAPVNLRDALRLKDGAEIEVSVWL